MDNSNLGNSWMIYGAGGFSGRLIAEEAVRRGYRPVLAGRRATTVVPLAEKLGCQSRIFPADEPEKIIPHLEGVHLLLNCAGPFSQTAPGLVTACLQRKIHYLDITGEHVVIRQLSRLDPKAREMGLIILPAVGFGVVPSDCMAAKLANRHPEADSLRLAFTGERAISKGTAKSMWEGAVRGGFVRWNGELVRIPLGGLIWSVPFPSGPKLAICVPWADIETAYHSTKIPNIMTFVVFPRILVRLLRFWCRLSRPFGSVGLPPLAEMPRRNSSRGFPTSQPNSANFHPVNPAERGRNSSPRDLTTGVVPGVALEAVPPEIPRLTFAQRFFRNLGWAMIERLFREPTGPEIAQARAEFYGEVSAAGKVLGTLALKTPGGYRLTVDTALAAVQEVLTSPPPPGFHTPATAFGEDFVLKMPEVTLA